MRSSDGPLQDLLVRRATFASELRGRFVVTSIQDDTQVSTSDSESSDKYSADANSPVSDSELSKVLQCPICLDTISAPVLVPCCKNSFCAGCIKKWHDGQVERSKTCPLCQKSFGTIDSPRFTNNLTLEQVVEAKRQYHSEEKARTSQMQQDLHIKDQELHALDQEIHALDQELHAKDQEIAALQRKIEAVLKDASSASGSRDALKDVHDTRVNPSVP
ncbi:hypothetical protein CYMTET_3519 [Cymbomonas tetramitiformis]|uniref:RING-type domain-containing protein n=1 Tax=Cymbomonas tetramitiformis TaxID=36881 RepID=A0AAE0H336_9CHLO|nr:hypothetical protein CYMTET_3519 [Cymbomonas tetramitiformis]